MVVISKDLIDNAIRLRQHDRFFIWCLDGLVDLHQLPAVPIVSNTKFQNVRRLNYTYNSSIRSITV